MRSPCMHTHESCAATKTKHVQIITPVSTLMPRCYQLHLPLCEWINDWMIGWMIEWLDEDMINQSSACKQYSKQPFIHSHTHPWMWRCSQGCTEPCMVMFGCRGSPALNQSNHPRTCLRHSRVFDWNEFMHWHVHVAPGPAAQHEECNAHHRPKNTLVNNSTKLNSRNHGSRRFEN